MKYLPVYIFLLFVIILFFTACSGQTTSQHEPHPAQSSVGDTVAALDKTIFIIYQAKDDTYWFGSNGGGVYHYNGEHLIHYTTHHGLPSDTIREIQEDHAGNIYFATFGGIGKFDGEKFTTLPVVKTGDAGWKLEPRDLWFRGVPGKNGPYRYDGVSLYDLEFPKNDMEDQFYKDNPMRPKPPYSPYEIYSHYKDSKGNLWFGTSNFGACRYDGKTLSWFYEDQLQYVPGGGSFGIRSVIEDQSGTFWICNTRYRYIIDSLATPGKEPGNHLLQVHKTTGIENLKSPDGEDHIYFMSAVTDNNGDLWMATYGLGVWKYDGKAVTHFRVKDGEKEIKLYSIYKDNHNKLWLGTHEGGAYFFNGTAFEKFRP